MWSLADLEKNSSVFADLSHSDPSAAPQEQSRPSNRSRIFSKAGNYNRRRTTSISSTGGFAQAKFTPKYLHSNATSHKWALGAMAELLDNSVDEIDNGATFLHIDV